MGSHFSRTYSKSILYKLLGVLSALFMCIPSCSKEELIWEELLAVPAKVGGCVVLTPEEAKQLYGLLYKVLGGLDT